MKIKKRSGRPLSIAEQEQIRMFTLSGMRQKHIAAQLQRCRPTIAKFQRRFGLPPHDMEPLPAETQKTILELAEHHGEPHIAAELGLPGYKVRKVMQRVRRPNGKRYWRTESQLRAIRTALRKSEARIAAEFAVPRALVSHLRRRMWQGSGRKKNGPNVDDKTSESLLLQFLNNSFPRGLPSGAALDVFVDCNAASVAERFRTDLLKAVHTLQRRTPDTRWTN